MEIEIKKSIDVPFGEYCIDKGAIHKFKGCEYIGVNTASIGLAGGLCSPESIKHYRCRAFDERLDTCYPHYGFYGLTIRKCDECADASKSD